VKPCEGRAELFASPLEGDHAQARVHCRGSKKYDIPPCPFIGWCIQEREAFQASEYRIGLHGTWHGVLFVDGKASAKSKRRPGRPRKVA
jgi:hypothetical protein